jgi:penicillin-binding protein-related factor A (putative recombinase)
MKLTEKQLENDILAWLWYVGIFAWKNQSVGVFDAAKGIYRKPVNRFHIKGVADILGVLPDGRMLAIEVKRPAVKARKKEQLEKMASDEQLSFLKKINNKNGMGLLVDNLETVCAALSDYVYKHINNQSEPLQ